MPKRPEGKSGCFHDFCSFSQPREFRPKTLKQNGPVFRGQSILGHWTTPLPLEYRRWVQNCDPMCATKHCTAPENPPVSENQQSGAHHCADRCRNIPYPSPEHRRPSPVAPDAQDRAQRQRTGVEGAGVPKPPALLATVRRKPRACESTGCFRLRSKIHSFSIQNTKVRSTHTASDQSIIPRILTY